MKKNIIITTIVFAMILWTGAAFADGSKSGDRPTHFSADTWEMLESWDWNSVKKGQIAPKVDEIEQFQMSQRPTQFPEMEWKMLVKWHFGGEEAVVAKPEEKEEKVSAADQRPTHFNPDLWKVLSNWDFEGLKELGFMAKGYSEPGRNVTQ